MLRGEISLGYGIADATMTSQLHPVDGLIIDANATWRVTDLTSVLFTPAAMSRRRRRRMSAARSIAALGVEVRHQLRSYLVASAGLLYSNQNSRGRHHLRQRLHRNAGSRILCRPRYGPVRQICARDTSTALAFRTTTSATKSTSAFSCVARLLGPEQPLHVAPEIVRKIGRSSASATLAVRKPSFDPQS